MKTKKKYIPADYDDLYDAEPHGTIDDRGVADAGKRRSPQGTFANLKFFPYITVARIAQGRARGRNLPKSRKSRMQKIHEKRSFDC